jgi:ATP-binding cassette subfamily B protein
MTTQQLALPTSLAAASGFLPDGWDNDVRKQLASGENVLTGVEVDLDTKLRFTKGILVVTNRRLLSRAPGEGQWRSWPFAPGLVLR